MSAAALGSAAIGVQPIAGEFGVALSAATAATSGVTGSLAVAHPLAGAANGASTTVAAVAIHRPLAAVTAGVSTLTVTMLKLRQIAASTAGISTATAAATIVLGDNILVPRADVAINSWTTETGATTGLYASIDDVPTANDADYIQSPVAPTTGNYYEGALETRPDPAKSTGHVAHYRYRKVGAAPQDLTVGVYQSTTLIASWAHTGIGTGWLTADQALTDPQADAITNYDDLRIRAVPNQTASGTERAAPDALTTQTNLAGTLANIQDDPDSPDANWLTASSNNVDTTAHITFPTPTDMLTPGVGLQEFRVLVKKNATAGTGTPTVVVSLYENGSLISSGVSTDVTSTTGQVVSYTWDASGRDAALIECRVVGSATGGGPSVRAAVDVGAVEWNASVSGRVQVSWANFEIPLFAVYQDLDGVSGGTSTVVGALGVTQPLEAVANGVSAVSAPMRATRSLVATSAAGATTTATLTTTSVFVATANAVSTVVANLAVAHPLAGQANGTAANSAGVLVGHLLIGTSVGTSTTTGSFVAKRSFAGVSSGATTAAAAVTVALRLAATSTGVSTATATLQVGRSIAATTAGVSSVTAAVSPVRGIAATAAGVSAATGGLTVGLTLAATSAAVSTVAGAVAVTHPLAATSAGASTVLGNANIARLLAGTAVGTSVATATLRSTLAFSGLTVGTSSDTGNLVVAHPLAAISVGASTAVAQATATWALTGTANGTAVNTAGVLVGHLMYGTPVGTSTIVGALIVAHPLAGSIAGTSTVVVALGRIIPLLGWIGGRFRYVPDGLVEQTNFAGVLADVQDPENLAGTWMTTTGSNAVLRFTFPAPDEELATEGDQEFRILVRP